ncbi:MAG: hypothetical protein ABI852_12030 [Gemmatimonadaceae bacterium]
MNLSGRKMLFPLSLAFTVVGVAVAVAPTTSLSAAQTAGVSTANTSNVSVTAEQRQKELRRIHVHFDSVLIELSTADVGQLTKSQQANRDKLVQTLRGYSTRGDFPHNYDFATPTPYFIDRKTGTLCAVAYLLESTGRRALVDRVARTNNNVWVADLKGDASFEEWLDENGITLNEAARIQVPYAGASSTQSDVALMAVGVGVPTALSLGFTAWNAFGNSNGHSRTGAYVGLLSGVATSAVGLGVRSQQANATGSRVAANSLTAVGIVGVAFAARSLVHRPRYLAARTEAENAKRANVQTSVSPIIPLGKDGGAGLSMSIRF